MECPQQQCADGFCRSYGSGLKYLKNCMHTNVSFSFEREVLEYASDDFSNGVIFHIDLDTGQIGQELEYCGNQITSQRSDYVQVPFVIKQLLF